MQDSTDRRVRTTTAFEAVTEFLEERLHDEQEAAAHIDRVCAAMQRLVTYASEAERANQARTATSPAHGPADVLDAHDAGVSIGSAYAYRISVGVLASAFAWHPGYRPEWGL